MGLKEQFLPSLQETSGFLLTSNIVYFRLSNFVAITFKLFIYLLYK